MRRQAAPGGLVVVARRNTLYRLTDGDRALLPERACAILDRFTELGFLPDFVAAQRQGPVLARALAPEFFDGFITQLEHRLHDPEYIELQKCSWDAMSWDPDDPRLDEIASALADNLLINRALCFSRRASRVGTGRTISACGARRR